jgi:hypothetical protein
MNMCIYFVD